jgi:hypothetical protein
MLVSLFPSSMALAADSASPELPGEEFAALGFVERLLCVSDESALTLLSSGAERQPDLIPTSGLVVVLLVGLLTLGLGLLGLRRRSWREWLGDAQPTPRPFSRGEVLGLVALLVLAGIRFVLEARASQGPLAFGGPDGDIFAQSFSSLHQGFGPFNGYEKGSHLRVHASPVMYLHAPLYALAPSPYTPAIFNAIFVASAVLPLYLMARTRLPTPVAVLATLLFICAPTNAALAHSGYHPVVTGLPLTLWLFYAFERRSTPGVLLASVLLMSCKENASLVVVFFGLWMSLRRESRWAGAFMAALGLFGFLLATRVLMPLHGASAAGSMHEFEYLGDGLLEILVSPVARPESFWGRMLSLESLRYLVMLLLPLGFLPLLRPATLAIATPILAQNLLSGNQACRTGDFHYDALLVPFLFVSAIFALEGLYERWGPYQPGALALLCAGNALVGPLPPLSYDPTGSPEADEAMAHVPAGVSVLAPLGFLGRYPDNPVMLALPDADAPPGFLMFLPEFVILPAAAHGSGAERTNLRLEAHERVASTAHYSVYRDSRPPAQRCERPSP